MSWITVVTLPEEHDRISAVYEADEDVFSGQGREYTSKWCAWLYVLFRDSYSVEDPEIDVCPSPFLPATGSVAQVRIRDRQYENGISCRDAALFHVQPTHKQEYRFDEWMEEA